MKSQVKAFFAIVIVMIVTQGHEQAESSADSVDLLTLSYKELMSVRTFSASNADESLFEPNATLAVNSTPLLLKMIKNQSSNHSY